MLVEIIKTHNRAIDPRTVIELKKGEIKNFDLDIAEDIILNDFGVEYVEKVQEPQEKVIKEDFENKAIQGASENKSVNKKNKNK